VLAIISAAGREELFRAIGRLPTTPVPQALTAMAARYGCDLDSAATFPIVERHRPRFCGGRWSGEPNRWRSLRRCWRTHWSVPTARRWRTCSPPWACSLPARARLRRAGTTQSRVAARIADTAAGSYLAQPRRSLQRRAIARLVGAGVSNVARRGS
jgi:hypothetical protein